jgi:hypothetical protein
MRVKIQSARHASEKSEKITDFFIVPRRKA